jgi:hypothetical protein
MQYTEGVTEVTGFVSQTHAADVFNVELHVALVSKNLASYIKRCCAGINTME